MRAVSYFVCVLLAGGFSVSASGEEPVLGQSSEYSAGPCSFQASPISFRGRDLGYAEAGFKLKEFSHYWIYQACVLSRDEPGMGSCGKWTLLHRNSGKVMPLRLPGFESFWSVPAFAWPYVAYVEILAPDAAQSKRPVYCVVFNYEKKKIVRRERQWVSEDTFATDFPEMFMQPQAARKAGHMVFSFTLDEAGTPRRLCDIHVP